MAADVRGGRSECFVFIKICAHAGVSLWQALFQLARTDKELVSTDYKIGSVVHRRKVKAHVLHVTYRRHHQRLYTDCKVLPAMRSSIGLKYTLPEAVSDCAKGQWGRC